MAVAGVGARMSTARFLVTAAVACWSSACGGDEDASGTGGAAGSSGSSAGSAGTGAGTGGAAGGGGAAGSEDSGTDAPPGPLGPEAYDCRAASVPDRRSTVPLGCTTDRTCKERMVSAHRGAGAPGVLAPENTLSALRAAIAVGADYTETDAQPTSDDIVVLVHDDTVDRTTDGSGRVADMTLAEVQALGITATTYDGDFACERVPTLVEWLDVAKGRITTIIDTSKTPRRDLIVAAVREADAFANVIFDHGDVTVLDEVLALEPTAQILVRATSQAELDQKLAHFSTHPPVYVHIGDASPSTMVPLVEAAGQRVFALGFGRDLVAGIAGDVTGYAESYDAGITILQSNRPELAAKFLGR